MSQIFVNLKRFEVPRKLGGVCPNNNPGQWIEDVIEKSIDLGIGSFGDRGDRRVVFFLPEALIIKAIDKLAEYPRRQGSIEIGCQGVFREDITIGGNFGAFTTNLPATAARNLGCSWSIIGHSEERKDKQSFLTRYEPKIETSAAFRERASEVVDKVINEETLQALRAGINVLLCIGETKEERGEGGFAEQKPRIRKVLRKQLLSGLRGVKEFLFKRQIVIGYEPVWAIGPGSVPPDGEYIGFVSKYIKEVVSEEYGFEPAVVYGGGLKAENAKMIGGISSVDGGLVALTRFSGEIGFEPEGLKEIVDKYLEVSS